MATSAIGGGGVESRNARTLDGITKRDSDRARFTARQEQRRAIANSKSHKRGFGDNVRTSERLAS